MIGFFKKMFASPEIKACYAALDEAERRFSQPFHRDAFKKIKQEIEAILFAKPGHMVQEINEDEDLTPRLLIYSFIASTSLRLLGTGQYHVYRDALNGIGEDLLKIYDEATDELVQSGYADDDLAEEQKNRAREIINRNG